MLQERPQVRLVRTLCGVYVLLLTALLLLPDPKGLLASLLGLDHLPSGTPGGIGEHFVFFTLLATLVLFSRLPWSPAVIAALLLGYAIGLECMQYLSPSRSVELRDFAENLLGLTAGTIVWRYLGKPASSATDGDPPDVDPPEVDR